MTPSVRRYRATSGDNGNVENDENNNNHDSVSKRESLPSVNLSERRRLLIENLASTSLGVGGGGGTDSSAVAATATQQQQQHIESAKRKSSDRLDRSLIERIERSLLQEQGGTTSTNDDYGESTTRPAARSVTTVMNADAFRQKLQ